MCRHVNTRRKSNMSVLAKFGKPLPPPRLDDYYEGADLSSSSESEEKPPPRSRHEPSLLACSAVTILEIQMAKVFG